MSVRRAAPLFLVALLLAGCGNPVHSHYSVKETATCLRKLDYRVDADPKLGPIEAAATEGALLAKERGNAVVITFSENEDEARNIRAAYRRFPPKRIREHINDVMLSQKNAVLLWTVTPPKEELDRVLGCLR